MVRVKGAQKGAPNTLENKKKIFTIVTHKRTSTLTQITDLKYRLKMTFYVIMCYILRDMFSLNLRYNYVIHKLVQSCFFLLLFFFQLPWGFI